LTPADAPAPTCWICGSPARTREHRSKASDLRSVFGAPTQDAPLYFSTDKRRNIKVGSLKSALLKFTTPVCENCNSARTQPYDRAWQWLSEALRLRQPPIAGGQIIRPNRIFPYNTRRQMRNVHFYFLKLFGCQILEGNLPIDIKPFSEAILQQRPHSNVYLAFGPALNPQTVGGSDVDVAMLKDKCAFATWFYEVDNLSVNIMYAIAGEKRNGLLHAWHPRLGHQRLTMATFLPT
jgi:hypothetical protein